MTLTIDGQSREVSTYASTAGEILADEGLSPASHDVVLPALDAAVGDGDAVVLNRARPLALTVDGVRSNVYTTALSVDAALDLVLGLAQPPRPEDVDIQDALGRQYATGGGDYPEAMDQALRMPLAERRERWFNMMDVLRRNDITRWRERFVTVLQLAA